jgi:hypothetical protein
MPSRKTRGGRAHKTDATKKNRSSSFRRIIFIDEVDIFRVVNPRQGVAIVTQIALDHYYRDYRIAEEDGGERQRIRKFLYSKYAPGVEPPPLRVVDPPLGELSSSGYTPSTYALELKNQVHIHLKDMGILDPQALMSRAPQPSASIFPDIPFQAQPRHEPPAIVADGGPRLQQQQQQQQQEPPMTRMRVDILKAELDSATMDAASKKLFCAAIKGQIEHLRRTLDALVDKQKLADHYVKESEAAVAAATEKLAAHMSTRSKCAVCGVDAERPFRLSAGCDHVMCEPCLRARFQDVGKSLMICPGCDQSK